MKTRTPWLWLMLPGLVAAAQTAWAKDLNFKYRNAKGEVYEIKTMADLDKYFFDANGHMTDKYAYKILKTYLEDVADIKKRVEGYPKDVEVMVNSSLDPATEPGSQEWPPGKRIQVQSWDYDRAISTLAHETSHAYQDQYDPHAPPWSYGADGAHFINEVTTVGSAFTEGYAEYYGGRLGLGQEPIGCAGAGDMETLKWEEGAPYIDATTGEKVYPYNSKKWADVTSAENMWKCEGINAIIMRDMAKYVPGGAAKIDALVKSGSCNSLEEVVKEWAKTYPKDADALAKIVDADTNYLMDDEALRDLTGADAYIDTQRDKTAAANKGKNSCDALEKIFAPPAGGGPATTGQLVPGGDVSIPSAGGGLPTPGTGGTGTGGGPALKPFR